MGAVTASATTRPPASTAAAPWASCSSLTGKRAKVGGCGWGWGTHCPPLGASDPRCVLNALRKGSDLAQLDIAPSAHWLGVCISGVGTGITPLQKDWDALLQAPCLAPCPWEVYGEEEKGFRSSWRQWHSPCGASGPHLTLPHSLSCPRGRAGCAGNPHRESTLLWECEMHRPLWGHCPARSEHHIPHRGEHPEMLHIPPTSPTPVPAWQGSPGCFPCTLNFPPSGLASACAVSFGSS